MAFDPRVSEQKNTGYTFRGLPITLSKTVGRPLEGKWKEAIVERGILPESKKLEVVSLFAITGDPEKVASLAKVPVEHIKKWRRTEWWREYLREIQEENNEKLDSKYTEIIQTAADIILDRLNNGDPYVHPRTGEILRKPVSIKDVAIVSAIKVDKRQLLRGLPTSRTESVGGSGKLERLAETFLKLANRTEPRTIEAEVVEIVETKPEEPQSESAEPSATNELFKR